jgi:hypothetical protein
MAAWLAGAQVAQAGPLGDMINKQISGHGDGPAYAEHPASFKGVDKVVIAQFSVVFLKDKVDYSGGGFLSSDGKAKATGKLTGVSEADYQKITDAAYADFVDRLKSAGVEVVPPDEYRQGPYYKNIRSEAQASPVSLTLQDQDKAQGVAYWPSSAQVRDNLVLNLRFMDGNVRNVSTAQYEYARRTHVPVINVVEVVDFAEPSKSSGGGVFQSVKATAEIALSHRGSKIEITDVSGQAGRIVINKPIVQAGGFAEIKDVTSGTTKTLESAHMMMNIGGALMGKGPSAFGRTGMERNFEFAVTDPAVYVKLTTDAVSAGSGVLIDQMRALK